MEKVEANKNLTRVPFCARGTYRKSRGERLSREGSSVKRRIVRGKKGRWKIRVEIVRAASFSMGTILNAVLFAWFGVK